LPITRSPSARARRLAAELRRLREAKGLTGEEVAARLEWSPSKVSRIETGRSAVTLGDLRRLLDLYEIAGSSREQLTELGRTAGQRGWWHGYGEILGYGYSTYLALEDDAESVHQYAQMIVPGILQTSTYAEEIIRVGLLAAPPGEIARRVQVRMTRQRRLTEGSALEVRTVLDESVLRRQVGGPEVMADQLSRLIEAAEHPNMAVQVLPFGTGAHIAMAGSFVVLRFPGAASSYAVYLENMTSELFIENEGEAFQYSLAFDRLREVALGPEESIRLIAQIAREIR
jgi:transcriptional regulator with XRE-family HTH domain